MLHREQPNELRGNCGMSLIEVMIAVVVLSIIMMAATLNLQQDTKALNSLARKTGREAQAERMLADISDQLEFAQGATPRAWLNTALTGGETAEIVVDTNLGFPDVGTLLVRPGTANEERIDYDGLTLGPVTFTNLTRGAHCTDPSGHPDGTLLRWSAVAEAIEDQTAPDASLFDGFSNELLGQVFFRGDGDGFSFRLPTDPAGGTNYFDFGGVRWGAEVAGVPTITGWSAIQFEAVAQITEAARGADINNDGDQLDTFDLGRLRHRSWDTANPGGAGTDRALCPPMILQEQCNYGSDLDGDGGSDPMFLWDPFSGRLRIRLFLLTSNVGELPEIRLVETAMYLRNGAQ